MTVRGKAICIFSVAAATAALLAAFIEGQGFLLAAVAISLAGTSVFSQLTISLLEEQLSKRHR